MNHPSTLSRSTRRRAEQVGRATATQPWVITLARWGYATKGLVYLLIGVLALKLALGLGGAATSRAGALRVIDVGPVGRILLAIVTVGLIGYALWSLLRAVVDPEGAGHGLKGVAQRGGYAIIGVSYATTAYAALRIVLGSSGSGGGAGSDAATRSWTARLLALPFGVALVVVVGMVVMGVAAFLGYRAYAARLDRRLDLSRLGAQGRRAVLVLGRCGYAALGVVFGLVGLFLVVAALRHNPHEARGLGGALADLLQQPYGHVLLAVVALGLIAYGCYALVQARYRRFARA
jgi:hypothetical protein